MSYQRPSASGTGSLMRTSVGSLLAAIDELEIGAAAGGEGAACATGIGVRSSLSPENGFMEHPAAVVTRAAARVTAVSRRLLVRRCLCRNMMSGALQVEVFIRMLISRCYNMSSRRAQGCQLRHISGPESCSVGEFSGGIV